LWGLLLLIEHPLPTQMPPVLVKDSCDRCLGMPRLDTDTSKVETFPVREIA